MNRLLFWLVLLLAIDFQVAAQTATPSSSEKAALASRTAGLTRHDGFFPYYFDEKKGDVLFELSPAALDREFLYFTGLGSGVGSTEVFADRSSFGDSALCRLRRIGSRVLVVEENTGFRAENGSSELKHSVEESFPTSVLASLPIEAEQDGTVLVNASPLLVRDAADLLSQLSHPTRVLGGTMVRDSSPRGEWRLDKDRSIFAPDHSGSFPLNTEIEMLLTFTTDSEGDLNQPDSHALSVREHHSFVALPENGYEVREQDPRVGFFTADFDDFSQPYNRPLRRYLACRWRLQKKDPTAALSEPVKPIVFYLDRAIPEPIRSAARQGALWWNAAFEQAGFKNALRIEDLPEGADPMDIRYSTIQWTNRSGRGWSVGQSQVDPRTGEIIHAVVQLDSHRMRTVNNYWQSTIPSGRDAAEPSVDLFAALDSLDPQLNEETVLVSRLALLTCHEVGHAIGLQHNFVASTFDRGSVMDYYAPRIRIRSDGSADLSDAYMQGVGSYDRFAVEWGYSQGKPGASADQEHARLDTIVKDSIAKGIVWGNYDDPRWNAYDDGTDPVTWLKEVLPVRDALLAHYNANLLRPGEQNSMLASRFALVYLFHRYALAAAVNVVGSAKVPLSLSGDGQAPIGIWPADSQKEALRLLFSSLDPAKLEVPAKLWAWLAPNENRGSNSERFSSSAGYLFSPQDGARAVAEIVVGGLLGRQRIERLSVIAQQDANAPSPGAMISGLVNVAFAASAKTSTQRDLLGAVQSEVADRLMILAADAQATPEVRSAALSGVRNVQDAIKKNPALTPDLPRIDQEIKLFLENPAQNTPKIKESGAPPGPPV
ncbi:MAG TPA: zinc-dependent metalloprotease [Terriglobales bacterium]|nr:zinc-dependent metalloprotease [Terriglobales bacterium]